MTEKSNLKETKLKNEVFILKAKLEKADNLIGRMALELEMLGYENSEMIRDVDEFQSNKEK